MDNGRAVHADKTRKVMKLPMSDTPRQRKLVEHTGVQHQPKSPAVPLGWLPLLLIHSSSSGHSWYLAAAGARGFLRRNTLGGLRTPPDSLLGLWLAGVWCGSLWSAALLLWNSCTWGRVTCGWPANCQPAHYQQTRKGPALDQDAHALIVTVGLCASMGEQRICKSPLRRPAQMLQMCDGPGCSCQECSTCKRQVAQQQCGIIGCRNGVIISLH